MDIKEGIIMATPEELQRLHIVKKVISKEVILLEASEMLCLSYRQSCRLVNRVRKDGDRGIVHKLRGRSSNRRIEAVKREEIVNLYRDKYKGFGPTFFSEKLLEEENIGVSKETVRKYLIEAGERERVRKARKHRKWRERKHYLGEMVQMDGSHHDWFEGRGSSCVFMGYIDDATGRMFGRFYEYEGTLPAFDSFKRYITKNGLPLSVYLDKHTTYKSTGKPTLEDELNNRKPLSQFERALKELGVKVLHANSPQAKGRIERLFGTLQDRLVKEMRLQGISSINEGNKFLSRYLPKYNKKFRVEALKAENMHRAIPDDVNLDSVLSIKEKRVLRNDFTISYDGKFYQIEDKVRAKKVDVEERINGKMAISYKGRTLRFKEISKAQKTGEKTIYKIISKPRKKQKPAPDHPWRTFNIKNINSYNKVNQSVAIT